MRDNDWRSYSSKQKPLVDTGRKMIPLTKYPQDLDFTKTVGGTTHVVNSHFKSTGKRVQQIDIYYNAVGVINIPTSEELDAMIAEYRAQEKQGYKSA